MKNRSWLSKPSLTSIFLGLGGFLYGLLVALLPQKVVLDLKILATPELLTPTLALRTFLGYFDNPDASLRGAIVSVYQAGGVCNDFAHIVFRH